MATFTITTRADTLRQIGKDIASAAWDHADNKIIGVTISDNGTNSYIVTDPVGKKRNT
jgi:hypothetical protein